MGTRDDKDGEFEGKVVLRMERVKQTHAMSVFKEQEEVGEPNILGSLYVAKWFAQGARRLTITIELEEEENDKK